MLGRVDSLRIGCRKDYSTELLGKGPHDNVIGNHFRKLSNSVSNTNLRSWILGSKNFCEEHRILESLYS